MAQNQFVGLLSQYGLPGYSQEELLEARTQQRVQQIRQSAQQAGQRGPRVERDFRRLGSLIGGAIGAKIDPVELSEEERQQYKIIEDATTGFNKWKSENPNALENPEDMALEYQRHLAEAAANNGDYAKAAQISMGRAQQSIAMQKKRKELKKLGIENEQAETTLTRSNEQRTRDLAGEYGTYVIPDEDGRFNIANLEQGMSQGRVNENGVLEVRDADGNVIGESSSYLTLSEAMDLREQQLDAIASQQSGGSGKSPTEWFLKTVPSSERAKINERKGAIRQQMIIMDGIADTFDFYMEKGMDPAAGLGAPAVVFDFVSDTVGTVRGLWSGGQGFKHSYETSIVNENGEVVVKNPQKIAESDEYASYVDAIRLPPDMEETGARAAEYRARIVELAYAVARANEPGARQLSDNDFKQALAQIGANADDPYKMQKVIMDNLNRKVKMFGGDVKRMVGIGATFGVPADRVDGIVFGGTLSDFDDEYSALQQKYTALGMRLSGQIPDVVTEFAGEYQTEGGF